MSDRIVARARSPRGEVILRRRERDDHLELRVNGVFVMDSFETGTERVLATLALDELAAAREPFPVADLRVLVGGLGLGYTMHQFAASPFAAEIVVAEIEPALVEWHRAGLIPDTVETVSDPRVSVLEGDIRDVVAARPPGSLDVIALDVDNGPGYLVYDENATIYEADFLIRCRDALVPDGKFVVWSGDRAPALLESLGMVFGSAHDHSIAVTLGRRDDHYHAYVAPSRREDKPCLAR